MRKKFGNVNLNCIIKIKEFRPKVQDFGRYEGGEEEGGSILFFRRKRSRGHWQVVLNAIPHV